MMRPVIALLLAPLVIAPALAQPRDFNCVGAEQIEDDVFVVPFARNSATVGDAARSALAAATEAAKASEQRNICVLGHAGLEGGATTSIRLAAQRAGAVAQALSSRGVERDRIRGEARSAQFSPRVRREIPPSRSVTIVVLPER